MNEKITVLLAIAGSIAAFVLGLFTIRPKIRKELEDAKQSKLSTHDAEFDLTEKVMDKYRELRSEVITLIEEGTQREAKFRELETSFRELAISENIHKEKLKEINISIEKAKEICTCGAWK